jgi:hypothetical protein
MAFSSRDRISVDLQGLKSALAARAEAMGMSPSDVVRQVLASALDAQPVIRRDTMMGGARRSISGVQRVSLRMDRVHVLALNEAAHRSGLRLSTYVAGLLDGVAALGGQGVSGDIQYCPPDDIQN